MTLGPLMLDLAGTELQPQERERLLHPLVGGVILFSRNYESRDQIEVLTRAIHQLREPRLLIAVDHEGGRVQRFRHGFAALPAARRLGALYDENPKRAKRLAQTVGWLMAAELRGVGVDFSFTPVLDLDRGVAAVIGDRAFHRDPEIVADLARAYMSGMRRAGMTATGKHFPGHGSCAADSHLTLPVDKRRLADIEVEDLVPFERLIHYGIAAMMAAHVLYPNVDARPAGFSRFWITEVLRRRFGFQGVIFSDDLSMEGAKGEGDMVDRVRATLAAGCDMALICNNAVAADRVLDDFPRDIDPTSGLRLVRLHGRPAPSRAQLENDVTYRDAMRVVANVA